MSKFEREYELFRGGLLTKIKVKEMPYDLVELTISKKLNDEETGKPIVDSAYTTFYTTREFQEFLTPFINDMKVKFENDNSNSN